MPQGPSLGHMIGKTKRKTLVLKESEDNRKVKQSTKRRVREKREESKAKTKQNKTRNDRPLLHGFRWKLSGAIMHAFMPS